MKIIEMKTLIKSDFSVYKNTLILNQKKILSKLEEEKIFISAMDIDTLE